MTKKKETDIFVRIEAAQKKAKELNKQFIKVACDDMSTFMIEDCKTCLKPCKDDEGPLILQLKIDEDE